MVVLKKTHKGWEKDVKRIKQPSNKFSTGYIIPSTMISVGSKGYRCENENSSLCKAYCCSLNVEINPLEIAIISHLRNMAPVEFVDYCELGTSEINNGPNYVNPLFALKKSSGENSRCLFNQADFKCGIYDARPMNCRAKPYYLKRQTLTQQKTCAGYKCGNKLSNDEFARIYEIAKISKIFSKLKFFVDFNDFEAANLKKMLQDSFVSLDIPLYNPVKNLDLESICEKMKLISNFEFQMKKYKISQNELLEVLTREMIQPALTDGIESRNEIAVIVDAEHEAQC